MSKIVNQKTSEREGTCQKKRLPYVFTKEQLIRLLSNVHDIKLAVIIFLGCFQGLRIGEIMMLSWAEVDLKHGELKVLDGKNTKRYKSGYGKDRIVPINDMFIHILQKWKDMNQGEDYVIPVNIPRSEKTYKRLIKRFQAQLWVALEESNLKEVAYLQKNGTPRHKYHMHTLRHVCGTNLYRAGMDIYQIKEYLGHANVEDTMIYCELAKDDLRMASHKAFAFPKSYLPIPEEPQIQVTMSKEMMELQREILDKKLQLAKVQQWR